MNWETKIRFALDICCGISYLNDCQILHHDIQSANILVDKNEKIKITNFGLSKKFHDLTRNISPNIENCEIYSVGALLWEIAELKKPHSDLNKSEILVGIRNRVTERYNLPFSDGIPDDWKNLVITAMLHEPACRPKISKICHKLHKLSKNYPKFSTLDDCTEDYDENLSSIDDNQIPELQKFSKDERVRIAVEIFKETADKGNPSAQLRYGICLWQGEAYLNGGNEHL
ncbi:unnamed protein product [Rhizophagus irregularis]|nr:unnamed protein product [Rhizophagus irregularis]